MAQLTPEQSEALSSAGGQPLAILDPKTQQTFFIVTPHDLAQLEELRDENRVLAAFSSASWRDAIQQMVES